MGKDTSKLLPVKQLPGEEIQDETILELARVGVMNNSLGQEQPFGFNL